MLQIKTDENLEWNSHIEVRQNGVALPYDEFGNTSFKNVYEADMFILKTINQFKRNINGLKKQIKNLKEKGKDTSGLEYNLLEQQNYFGIFRPEVYQVLNGEDIRLVTWVPDTKNLCESDLDSIKNKYETEY